MDSVAIFSHGELITKNNTSVSLNRKNVRFVIVMNCMPQRQACSPHIINVLDLFMQAKVFEDIKHNPSEEHVKTLVDHVGKLNPFLLESSMCYFFDTCPNIFLTTEKENWNDGVVVLPNNMQNLSASDIIDGKSLDEVLHLIDSNSPPYKFCLLFLFACTHNMFMDDLKYYPNNTSGTLVSHPFQLVKKNVVEKFMEKLNGHVYMSVDGGAKPGKIYVLGHDRNIVRKGRQQYVRYKNELIPLKKAKDLEKRLRVHTFKKR